LISSISPDNLLQVCTVSVYLCLTQYSSSIVRQNRLPFLKVVQNFLKFIDIHIHLNAELKINKKPANKSVNPTGDKCRLVFS